MVVEDQSFDPKRLKVLNSLVVLGSWMLWKHHNDFVFDGSSPNVLQTLRFVLRESDLWSLAGARGLAQLEADIF